MTSPPILLGGLDLVLSPCSSNVLDPLAYPSIQLLVVSSQELREFKGKMFFVPLGLGLRFPNPDPKSFLGRESILLHVRREFYSIKLICRNLYALFSHVKKGYTANQNGVQLFHMWKDNQSTIA